jgi:hypothetical protein
MNRRSHEPEGRFLVSSLTPAAGCGSESGSRLQQSKIPKETYFTNSISFP